MQYIEESQDICHAAVESEGQLTWASIAPLCFCSENTFHFVGELEVQESQKDTQHCKMTNVKPVTV